MTDEDTLRGLATKVTDRRFQIKTLDGYYDGELRLAALGISLPPEMRALQTVINWPRLTVDALQERIDLQGFRMRGVDDTDDRLWSWWQANNLDEESGLGHLETFVQGRSYVTVGFDDDRPDVPIITCESARNMFADVDTRTRRVKAAVRVYDHDVAGQPRAATLYLPGRNLYYVADRGRWVLTDTIETGIDRVPVVPMVNRARLHDRSGRSEMADVMGITDAACRNLTNLQGAQELMALPTRYVFGVGKDDMKNADGQQVTKWEGYLGRFNTIGDAEAKVVQLAAADLRNFTETLNGYARLISSVTGMPPHFLGLSSENPASADAIRSSEARHIKRAEQKCRVLGGVWEEVMRLALAIVDGDVPEEAERMEAVFADAATPTYSSRVDAVVKLYAATDPAGRPLLPREAAWEELGYSPERRRRLAQMAADEPMQRLASAVGVDEVAPAASAAPGQPGGLLARLGASPTDGVTP